MSFTPKTIGGAYTHWHNLRTTFNGAPGQKDLKWALSMAQTYNHAFGTWTIDPSGLGNTENPTQVSLPAYAVTYFWRRIS